MCRTHLLDLIYYIKDFHTFLENMHLEQMTLVIFSGDPNLISGRSPQVVKTKKTRSAVVISFQVVPRRDGGSKVHSRRIWYSIF